MTIPARPRNHRRGRRSATGKARPHEEFLGRLDEALRPLSDPLTMRGEAARLLGRQLRASRVHYADVTPDGSEAVIRGEYCDGVGSIAGRHPLKAYGPAVVEAFAAGTLVVVDDAVWDPGLTRQERLGALSIGARAYVVAPVVREGGLAAILAVHQVGPRTWSRLELEMVESAAERTWSAVERAGSRAALQESETRFRTILDSIDQAYSLVQLAFDADDQPVDYRILEANRSFARHTGLDDAVGKWAREMVPDLPQGCFDAFGEVALTGRPARFEKRVPQLGRWFEVDAFRVEPAHTRRVGVVFRDITERRVREANRSFLASLLLELANGTDAGRLLAQAGERIVSHVDVALVRFIEVEPEAVDARVLLEYRPAASGEGEAAAAPPARRPLEDLFGRKGLQQLREGRPVVIHDAATDARTPSTFGPRAGLRGTAHLPCLFGGRLAFVLSVGQRGPRRWRASEIELLHDLSHRLWSRYERARADDALRHRERELRELSRSLEVRITERTAELEEKTHRLRRLAVELASAEQRERKRLGSVLHDHLQQLLFAARMHLDRVESRIGEDAAASAATEDAKRQLADAIEAARDLSRQLRPPALYEAGLGAAITWLASEMSRMHGLEVAIEEDGPVPSLGDDLKALVFECIRELLFNVVKHAEVDAARVRIGSVDGRLRLAVSDEGRGFEMDPQGPGRSDEGSGLFSVCERLAAVGGTVEIDSRPGDGTRVKLEVPAS